MAEPTFAIAGQKSNWNFVYIPSTNVPAKTTMRFDPHSKGKETDWELPLTDLKKGANVIWLDLPSGKRIAAKQINGEDGYVQYEFTLPEEIAAGERIQICIGTVEFEKRKELGTTAQSFIQRRRYFSLYVDPTGKQNYKEPEIFNVDVKGNKLENIRIVAPSVVYKNKRFDVIVRFEDQFGNPTGNAPEGTLIELTYDQLRDNLNWKLFVPETGYITLPNVYFNEEGIYQLKMRNLTTGEEYTSPPIKCFLEESPTVSWGILHGDCTRHDLIDQPESALRYIRDDMSLQFFATSPQEGEKRMTNDRWKGLSTTISEFNEDDRFVSMLGSMWVGTEKEEGVRQFVFLKDNKPLLRKKDAKASNLKKIYKLYTPKEFLSIPQFTMGGPYAFDFDQYNSEFERVVEIYNTWGSSECTEKEGNPKPIKASKSGTGTIKEAKAGSIRKALGQNKRFGFVAGGYDESGIYKDLPESQQHCYTPGMTAIISTDYSREALFQALYNRHTYATTGERMVVSFNLAGQIMGSEVQLHKKPGLEFSRYLHGFVAGTTDLQSIEIFRNGELFKEFRDLTFHHEFEIDDTDALKKIAMKSPDDRPDYVYYYLRAIQADGHVAWSSPIWLDLTTPEANETLSPKKRKK